MGILGTVANVGGTGMIGHAGVKTSKDNIEQARKKMMGFNLDNARKKLGMTKTASLSAAKPAHTLVNSLKYGAILGGVMGATRGVAALAGKAYDNYQISSSKRRLFSLNPEWKQSSKANELFDILADFAPNLASNPPVARDFIARGMRFDTTPHEFIREIASIQKDVSGTQFRGGIANDIHEGFKAGIKIDPED